MSVTNLCRNLRKDFCKDLCMYLHLGTVGLEEGCIVESHPEDLWHAWLFVEEVKPWLLGN